MQGHFHKKTWGNVPLQWLTVESLAAGEVSSQPDMALGSRTERGEARRWSACREDCRPGTASDSVGWGFRSEELPCSLATFVKWAEPKLVPFSLVMQMCAQLDICSISDLFIPNEQSSITMKGSLGGKSAGAVGEEVTSYHWQLSGE